MKVTSYKRILPACLAAIITFQLGITMSIKCRKVDRRLQSSVTASYYKGAIEAEYDRLLGKTSILCVGMETRESDIAREIYKKKLNIDLVSMGCTIDGYKGFARIRGYNEVMYKAILKKYGKAKLQEIGKEISREAKARVKANN